MCRKRRYRNRVDALIDLARIDGRVRTTGQSDKAPVEAYRCRLCRGWHLTSQAR
jgi:hypothetical protein